LITISVYQDGREIGIRKAIGVYDADTLVQFLMSVLLCLMGSVLGITLGVGGVSGLSIALSVAMSFAVGVFFRFYPARKAARMNPIDALRFE
jgi:putative ABC transport system permease protein